MHVPTHIMSGWCMGNLFRFTPRERVCCMAAATAADLDGISYLFGQEAYWDYHHVLCHNLAFSMLLAAVLVLFSTHRLKGFFIYLALAHVHLGLDYFGSGPGWPIPYGWPPFDTWTWKNPDAWEFTSWQNRSAALGFLFWVLVIAVVCGRTPVETLAPALDQRFVSRLRRVVGFRPALEVDPQPQ
jgi:inner membrane protein